MSRYFPAIAVLLALIPAFAGASDLKGKTVRPFSNGCEEIGGMIPAEIADASTGPTYGITEPKCRQQLSLVLQRKIGNHGNHTVWTVIDQVTVSKPTLRHEFLESAFCASSRFPNDSVCALGEMMEQPDRSYASENVVAAWRFDVQHERLTTIPVDGVLCDLDPGD
ncbi:hypothetical protein CO667_14610 [Rhizobium sp. L43]|nr:hypothetical protein CO667_14610 [Rhizobium sp. L43]